MQINIGTTRKSKIYRISACKCLIHMTPGDHLEREIPSKCRTRGARTFEHQVTELHVRVALLNRFTQLGRPATVAVPVMA